jgi:MFS family permease
MAEVRSIDPLAAPERATLKARHIAAVAAGNALEVYDFVVYTFFAIQIGKAFFPSTNPYVSLMLSLGTFGAGFLTRPLGGLVIGAYADRVGRRPAMLLSFILMGLAVLALAVIPPYSRIGLAAPVLAIAARMLQGFSFGGETGPATAWLLESAPVERRGLIVSLQGATQRVAGLVGALLSLGLTSALSPAAFSEYGWRIAFLLGAATVPFALLVRRSLPESLHAPEPNAPGAAARAGVRANARPLILGLLIFSGATISRYVVDYYTATFAQSSLHMTPAASFAANILPYPVGFGGVLLGGWLSDRLGRRPVMIWPSLLQLLLVLPVFSWIVAARDPWVLAIGMAVLSLPFAVSAGAYYPAITESLPKTIRGSGFALVFALANVLFGGTTQLVVTWLIHVTGNATAPAWYIAGGSFVALIACFLFAESAPARLAAPVVSIGPAARPA